MKSVKQPLLLSAGAWIISLLLAFSPKPDGNDPYPIEKLDDETSQFLISMTDARLMDIEESKLAVERGTIEEVVSYGRWMLSEQAKLLHELKVLASKKGVNLPTALSEEKANALDDLKKEHGGEFEKKYIKMIMLDHKRDVHEFRKATSFEDVDVKNFAAKFLPVIESHLRQIQKIKKEEKQLSYRW
jgi:putative membrane protein